MAGGFNHWWRGLWGLNAESQRGMSYAEKAMAPRRERGFPRRAFLAICPSVRPIQQLDSRKKRRPFLLLPGEKAGMWASVITYFPPAPPGTHGCFFPTILPERTRKAGHRPALRTVDGSRPVARCGPPQKKTPLAGFPARGEDIRPFRPSDRSARRGRAAACE